MTVLTQCVNCRRWLSRPNRHRCPTIEAGDAVLAPPGRKDGPGRVGIVALTLDDGLVVVDFHDDGMSAAAYRADELLALEASGWPSACRSWAPTAPETASERSHGHTEAAHERLARSMQMQRSTIGP